MFTTLLCFLVAPAAQAEDVIHFVDGVNIASFRVLPEEPTIANTLGELADSVVSIRTDGAVAVRLNDGTWAGNLERFSRVRSYEMELALEAASDLNLLGAATDPDIHYNLRTATNRPSYPCKKTQEITSVLGNAPEGTIKAVTGQYGGASLDGGTILVGDLEDLSPNHGYLFALTGPVRGFTYLCEGLDGVDPYRYGCMDRFASNRESAAEIDDGSCTYGLPSGWGMRDFSTEAFYLFHDLRFEGGVFEASEDVLGVFIGDQLVGFGHTVDGAYTTAPARNVTTGDLLTFRVFDADQGTVHELNVTHTVMAEGEIVIGGCTLPGAENFNEHAILDIGNCRGGGDTSPPDTSPPDTSTPDTSTPDTKEGCACAAGQPRLGGAGLFMLIWGLAWARRRPPVTGD